MGADRPLDTCSAVVKSWTWGDVPSHHLCSWERGIPLHPWQPPRVTVPPRTPQGTRPSLPARVSPPRAAKAELGQPHWVTLTPGGLSCSPPKKELLLGVLGSSQAEIGEGGGRGWISTGGAAWERPGEQLGRSHKGTMTIPALHTVPAPQPHQFRRQQWHRMGWAPSYPAPPGSVPMADTGLAVPSPPPVAKERLWLWALALGDVPPWCPRSHLSTGQSQAVHQRGWFAPAAQTSRV